MTGATAETATRRPTTKTRISFARRDDYVLRHYALVEKVAKRLARRLPASTDFGELVSAGALGLLEAAARFDSSRGESFETFARIRIEGAMLDDIRVRDTMSRDMRRQWRTLNRSLARLTQRLGRRPTEGELADELGVSVDELRARRKNMGGSRVIGFDDAGQELLERLADDRADDPQEIVARRELLDQLSQDIATLAPRTQHVLSLYYRENLSLKEIGVVLGVSECRVCQIHGEAMKKLRAASDLREPRARAA
ncbi:MAG TPA: RNA polymerase sigma factor FliA [Polyangia bacterium]|nr:RNA polymerase sigma factor FliA [Polyangia bacterium]